SGSLQTLASFLLQPGQVYLLAYPVAITDAEGVALITGATYREARLTPQTTLRYASVWTSQDRPVTASLQVVLACTVDSSACRASLGPIVLAAYTNADMTVRLRSITPYEASVSLPGAGFVETHRMFWPGYHASVNGASVAPADSSRGRVMIPVPAGDSTIDLDYQGTAEMYMRR